MVDLFRGKQWDLVGRRNLWFAISAAAILVGVAFWARQGLNYGIDFTGGGLLSYKLPAPIPRGEQAARISEVRGRLEAQGVTGTQIQIAGTPTVKDQLLIRTQVKVRRGEDESEALKREKERINSALQEQFPGATLLGADMVTGVVSGELKKKATVALLIGSLLVLVYITFRYDYRFAVAAIIALGHDMLVLTGWFAIFQKEVNTPFVAALLTVVGYSVHDTIVIFDRVRENVKLRKAPTFAEITNISLLETMARSVNTVLTVVFVLVALLLLGGTSMRDFAEALIVGVATGAYSSIFNASQIVVVWKQREERRQPGKAPVPRPVRTSPPSLRRTSPAGASSGEGPAARSPGAAVSAATDASEGAASARTRLPRSQRKKLKGKKRKRRF